jgi:hypothetical protein
MIINMLQVLWCGRMLLKSRLSTPDFIGLTCGDIVIQRISMSTLLERFR